MTRLSWLMVGCVLVGAGSGPSATSDGGFFFKDGDRILFLGDSITEQYQYTTEIETYLTTRFPHWKLTFLNAGIGGDTAHGGAARFQGHVLAETPTAMTINFGMNDAGYGAFNQGANDRYVKSTAAMLDAARKAGVRVALLSPNAVDRRVQKRFSLYLETQKQFYAPLATLATEHGATFVDQYADTRRVLETLEAKKAIKVVPFGDGFHTSAPGGLLMAYAILKGLHAPKTVTTTTIDVSDRGGKYIADRAKVALQQFDKSAIVFERLDESLPMPVRDDCVSLLPFLDDLNELNWYGLTIAGLDAGQYAVSIDGVPVATFSEKQLAAGVNLGNLTKGPLHAQAMKVRAAIDAKNRLLHERFRKVLMSKPPGRRAEVEAELAKRMSEIDGRQAEIRGLARPVRHKFEIRPVARS